MCACKNSTFVVAFYDEEDSNVEVFGDAYQRFSDYFSGMGVHSERGFLFDMKDDHLRLPGDLWRLIKTMKWKKLCKQP